MKRLSFFLLASVIWVQVSLAAGGEGPGLMVYPKAVHFEPAEPDHSAPDQVVYLQNSGEDPVVIARWQMAGPQAPDFHPQLPTPLVIAPNEEIAVQMTFSPGGRGTRTAEWRVWIGGKDEPYRVKLLGSGGRGLGLHLETNIRGRGTVERIPDQALYDEGDRVVLRAVPAEGWEFVGWRGAVSGKAVETEILMNVDRLSNWALFEPMRPQRRLLYRVNVGGPPVAAEPLDWRADLPARKQGFAPSSCENAEILLAEPMPHGLPAETLRDDCRLRYDERPMAWRFPVRDNGAYQVIFFIRGKAETTMKLVVQRNLVKPYYSVPQGGFERLAYTAYVVNGLLDLSVIPVQGIPGLEAVEIWKLPAQEG